MPFGLGDAVLYTNAQNLTQQMVVWSVRLDGFVQLGISSMSAIIAIS